MYILKITHVPYTNVLVLSFSPYRATFSFVLPLLGLLGGGVTNNIRTATPHVSCLFASFVPLKLASETLLDQLVDVCSWHDTRQKKKHKKSTKLSFIRTPCCCMLPTISQLLRHWVGNIVKRLSESSLCSSVTGSNVNLCFRTKVCKGRFCTTSPTHPLQPIQGPTRIQVTHQTIQFQGESGWALYRCCQAED